MDIEQSKKLIEESKNIYIIPNNKNCEAVASAMALFYTLNDLHKNVNLLIEDIPDDIKFLLPSLDSISLPKNFIISIPNKVADISQIYYEKNSDALKIHLAINKGGIKKEDISFYFSEPKPDLIITLGITDFNEELKNSLNSFGFLLGSTILNIDNEQNNKKFGTINIVENVSLAEMLFELISMLENHSISEKTATCLLTGITFYTENFSNKKTSADVFGIAGILMRNGATLKETPKQT